MSGVSVLPRRMWGWNRHLAAPFGAFIVVVIFQAIVALVRFGNVIIPLIGLSAYLTPFIVLCFIYQIVVHSPLTLVTNFLRVYVVCASLALATLYLQYVGYDWSILGEVGSHTIVFDRVSGARLSAYCGVFRTSEVAAWHAATCLCFFAILIINRRMTLKRALVATVFALAIVGLGMITGRRKFLVDIVIFVAAYSAFILYFGRSVQLAFLSGFIGLAGFLAFTLWVSDDGIGGAHLRGDWDKQREEQYVNYVSRTKSVFGDVPGRFVELGLAPIVGPTINWGCSALV